MRLRSSRWRHSFVAAATVYDDMKMADTQTADFEHMSNFQNNGKTFWTIVLCNLYRRKISKFSQKLFCTCACTEGETRRTRTDASNFQTGGAGTWYSVSLFGMSLKLSKFTQKLLVLLRLLSQINASTFFPSFVVTHLRKSLMCLGLHGYSALSRQLYYSVYTLDLLVDLNQCKLCI